ncbi:TRAP transporter small permease [Hydrogenophaga defluvii]|uniref:TRAP transporter small permease protein n=1 Tax=Hydrogenophaga defluvii TaxID=249410 RepID=A0ABW2S9X3_9BURK
MHKLIAFWEGWAAYVLLPALALLVTVDVSLRYVFNAPLAWGTDVKELLLLLVMTVGLAGTSWADEHIRVTLVEERLSPSLQRGFTMLRRLLTATLLALLAWAMAVLALDMREFGERAEFVAIPFWPLAALAATSALLAAVVEVVRLTQKGGR